MGMIRHKFQDGCERISKIGPVFIHCEFQKQENQRFYAVVTTSKQNNNNNKK